MKFKISKIATLFAFFSPITFLHAAPDVDCFYETYEVQVHVVECEYEASLEYFGIPNYNTYPNGSSSCPTENWRKVSLEKDITKVRVKTQVGSPPACGSLRISYDWNGTTNVGGVACDYWWREAENVQGTIEESGVRTETRTRRVCLPN
ncbi:hypothetical protein [Agaribacter marinus]|uniref:AA1-like domain-containing protein n=1 Tax=Agaribacter marinus TaxID=1431249 RepID=A0AA37SZF6_9ALTE|nr:hypothetical protein [Agaribacter marinus]GLR71169.1 hypothetical protein GCM10007852_20770 [Agaribacter marinus]